MIATRVIGGFPFDREKELNDIQYSQHCKPAAPVEIYLRAIVLLLAFMLYLAPIVIVICQKRNDWLQKRC